MENHEVTELLARWGDGDKQVLDRLLPLVYAELHRMAARYLRSERVDHTLQPTALINEAYLRLVGSSSVNWEAAPIFSESLPESCAAFWSTMPGSTGRKSAAPPSRRSRLMRLMNLGRSSKTWTWSRWMLP